MVLVVVCLPELSAREISAVCASAPGLSQLMSVLLPAPEGPSSNVVLPDIRLSSVAWSAVLAVLSAIGSTG